MNMRFHITKLVLITLTYCSAAKDNLRGGSNEKENDIDAIQKSEEVNRFLNVPEKDNDTNGGKRFIVKYKSHDGMVRSQSKRKNRKPAIMTMQNFSMQVVKLANRQEIKELKDDDDVLYVEPGALHPIHSSFYSQLF